MILIQLIMIDMALALADFFHAPPSAFEALKRRALRLAE